ncbi:MAG: hypothetical protein JSR82_11840 [Verrucomicrobia bacterium]|nr:hypothetical protein [Verrucomicrobiota bacterium]
MHPRRLAPAFVLTALAATGCTPPRARKVGPPPGPPKHVQVHDFADLVPQNPSDPKGRTIYAQGTACVVHVPSGSKQTSWQPPETKVVDCPPQMDDPAWDHCPGVLHRRKGEAACICTMDGNPPPPPSEVPCPK